MPIDLQKYINVIDVASNNQFIGLNGQSEIPAVPFYMCYTKNDNRYEYSIKTKDVNYSEILETTAFEKNDEDDFYYALYVDKREDAINSLGQVNTRAKKIMEIKYNVDNYFFEQSIDNNLWEYDEDNGFHI